MTDEEKIIETCKGLEYLLDRQFSYKRDVDGAYWLSDGSKPYWDVCITANLRTEETVLDFIFFVMKVRGM